ncbi:MAG: response regulator [Acidobacteriota bacterium]
MRLWCETTRGSNKLHFERYKAKIRLVLTDLMMPGMDGLTIIRAMRRASPNLKIIAATGLIDDARAKTALDLGVQKVLSKPYSPLGLLNAVRETLGS